MKFNKMNYPQVDGHNRILGEKTVYIIEFEKEEARVLASVVYFAKFSGLTLPSSMVRLSEYLTKEGLHA